MKEQNLKGQHMKPSIETFVELFKTEPGFERLFQQLYDKFRSYGRLEKQVTIVIEQPSQSEKYALGGLLGKDYSKHKRIKLSIDRLEKALRATKFSELLDQYSVVDIVAAYFGQALVSKRLEADHFFMERQVYFACLKSSTSADSFHRLLTWMEQEGNGHNRFYQLFRQDRPLLEAIMPVLMKACEAFPLEEDVYLPVFAANLTNDPHALDLDREAGAYFIYMLLILARADEENDAREGAVRYDLNAEEITQLLLEFRIMRDDLLNFVTLFHMSGILNNGQESGLLKGAALDQACVHLPLREVLRLKSVSVASVASDIVRASDNMHASANVQASDNVHASDNVPKSDIVHTSNIVYMIENSAVSAHIISKLIQAGQAKSVITGNGRLNNATLRLLDIFVEGGGAVYYAGDFDPEGLGIAQKLLHRYGDRVKLWRYDIDSYRYSCSDKLISAERLKQLDNITHAELQAVKEEMLLLKKAGYQENMLEMLLKDIM